MNRNRIDYRSGLIIVTGVIVAVSFLPFCDSSVEAKEKTFETIGEKSTVGVLHERAIIDRKKTVAEKNVRSLNQVALDAAHQHPSTREKRKSISAQTTLTRHRQPAPRTERARAVSGDGLLREKVQGMIANDDLRGEDVEVRQVALKALGNHAGTIVVMDPRTGRVFSIVNQQWAVTEGFKPCSTIKLVTSLAGLNEQVIDTSKTGSGDARNLGLTRALAYSNNDYFQEVGREVGLAKMLSYARRFGLGEKTGINLPSEFAGQLPDIKSPGIARISSHGDDFQVTALQLATLVSAIGNGGNLLTPYIARSPRDAVKFHPKVRRQIQLDSEAWKSILPGMAGVVSYGSGKKAFDPRQVIVGKTGTCTERGEWVGLFTSYAPVTNPRLAVVVILRGADAKDHFAAAVAGRIYRDLNERFAESRTEQLARSVKSASKQTKSPNSETTETSFVKRTARATVDGYMRPRRVTGT